MKPIFQKGQLTTWKDDRGFGFIKPAQGSKEIFLHISALKRASRRPKVGDTILYQLTTQANGKLSASNASIEGVLAQTLPKKQNVNKHRLLPKFIGIGVMFMIVILSQEFNRSRSPSLIKLVTKPGCQIKGNISIDSGAKVYHVPGAEDYESTVIDPARGERWFCTESEALANGWRKAPR
ncbi:cold shock domain-containing protein [Desmonostoc muscorum LEGE 12446]|uniref:Cold shock domain-containing protein n=1 Tax=Desmonostoc muscorum LEGE 12446 TaxID=1828758 RepID=A0A8J6ZM27_DESMC|nr:cold shock domain-containing protein [Desmonostoc muscorum]MCF2147065.1 cold shock domain-containing protein [Desmonostoc muscorum LEGE 12446]